MKEDVVQGVRNYEDGKRSDARDEMREADVVREHLRELRIMERQRERQKERKDKLE